MFSQQVFAGALLGKIQSVLFTFLNWPLSCISSSCVNLTFYHASEFHVIHSSQILTQLTCMMPVITMYPDVDKKRLTQMHT